MRYTESRLSKISEILLSELGQGTVNYQSNFDGTLEEPQYLPALTSYFTQRYNRNCCRYGNGYPPHNLNEVANATIMLLDNPNADLDQLMTTTRSDFSDRSGNYFTERRNS